MKADSMKIFNCDARVIKNIQILPDYQKLVLEIPFVLTPRPGQFTNILVEKGFAPLLRRPFSIYDYRCKRDSTEIDILFNVVGKGTSKLAKKSPDDMVGFLGPLGKGFQINTEAKIILLVAGGVGIAPLHFLAKELTRIRMGKKIVLLFGAETKIKLCGLLDMKKLGLRAIIATEDGSAGRKGLVTELLEEYIKHISPDVLKDTVLYSCGPEAMIEKVLKIAKSANIKAQVSLERRMACGLGACGGCVTKVIEKENTFRYSRICVEGPVYNADELYYEGL